MYEKVIVAIDFADSSQLVIDRALELVNKESDRLVLVHVVEPIPQVWGMESYAMNPADLQQQIVDSSTKLLAKHADSAGLASNEQYTLLGSPAVEIRELQQQQNADAIVIGSHGHSGWKVMLGSTANKLLHGAICDVLVVHVGDD